MIGRRKSPDGLPFRLYPHYGKRTTSFGYKLPNGEWEFRLSAPTVNKDAVAKIKAEAIARANVLNGDAPPDGTVAALLSKYFKWQYSLPADSEDRKASSTLAENEREKLPLIKVFGQMRPADIKPKHVYGYLAGRAAQNAPKKANKEIALLSAVLEYGRRLGELEANPCRGIQYNKTKPKDKIVTWADLDYAVQEARRRGGCYLVLALTVLAAYMLICRPTEIRTLMRSALLEEGVKIPIGKRKKGHAQRYKLIEWTSELRAAITEALTLQKTTSIYIFGNQAGQVYSRTGWSSNWSRLMTYCEKRAKAEGVTFERFTLADMRPTAVTDRMEEGDEATARGDATGHTDDRMVKKVYDRRRVRKAKATALKG